MEHGELFRLTRDTMAITLRNSGNVAIIVPEGAVIEVLGAFTDVLLADVRYNGEAIVMFANDLESHMEQVLKAKSAGE